MLLPTIKQVLLPTINRLLPTLMLLPTVYGKKICSGDAIFILVGPWVDGAHMGQTDIVSTRGATMVGAEGKFFEIWTLQIALKWAFPGLDRRLWKGKRTFTSVIFAPFCNFILQIQLCKKWGVGATAPCPYGCYGSGVCHYVPSIRLTYFLKYYTLLHQGIFRYKLE